MTSPPLQRGRRRLTLHATIDLQLLRTLLQRGCTGAAAGGTSEAFLLPMPRCGAGHPQSDPTDPHLYHPPGLSPAFCKLGTAPTNPKWCSIERNLASELGPSPGVALCVHVLYSRLCQDAALCIITASSNGYLTGGCKPPTRANGASRLYRNCTVQNRFSALTGTDCCVKSIRDHYSLPCKQDDRTP